MNQFTKAEQWVILLTEENTVNSANSENLINH